ncbi:hypothetical protein [Streptomyces albidochromogenes]|uniref:DUF2336 domain-containing protein n=1 Tax=Streptomyces albidochromogenes TaxID=329524 RepID=A0ABW6FFC1_9ACTN
MNQDWHLRYVRIPEGAHLSDSKETVGAQRDLLREDGTNKLLGPTESIPADEDALLRVHALSPAQQLVAEVLKEVAREVVVPILMEVVAPAVKRNVSRMVKSLLSATRAAGDRADAAELAVQPETPPADSSKEMATAVEEPQISMSSEEYRESLIAVLAAEGFAARQKRMLSNAIIQDDDLSPALRSAITLVLEGNASSLDEETREEVVRFLSRARIADGGYAQPENRKAKAVSPRRGITA